MRPELGLKLLIIDDDPDILGILAYDYTCLKCKVETATTSAEGLEKLKSTNFDLIISDLRLSEGGGEELLFACSQMLLDKKPAFILMTGAANGMNAEVVHHLGAEGFIQKPFTRSVLYDVVRRVTLPPSQRWKKSPVSVPTDALKLEVRLEDIQKAMESKTFKLGRGGLFVALENELPGVDEILTFDIEVNSEGARMVGIGLTRWNRSHTEINLPSGIGIEILELDENSLKFFGILQSKYPTRAFIPRM
jgi:DNA-binding response OmpR family regulator